MPKKIRASEDTILRRARWASLKEEYLDCMIHARPVTWDMLGEKYGFSSQTIRNKASGEGWAKEVAKRKQEASQLVESKMVEATSLATEKLKQDFATNEAAIRSRHASIARALQVKAMARLREFDMKDFKPRDALAMLELGLREERFAVGMKETADPLPEQGTQVPQEYKSVAEAMGGHRKLTKIGMLLLDTIRSQPVEAIMDEPEDVEVKAAPQDAPPPPSTPAKPTLVIKKAGAQ